MASDSWITEAEPLAPAAGVRHLRLRSRKRIEFLDVTEAVADAVRQAQVGQGLVSVQTLHTTTAIVVNENEPGLLEDMVGVLEKLAPRGPAYRHDDLSRRPGVPPDEPANGDAHCKAMLLPASQTLAVHHGQVLLGLWQRIFLLELDGGRPRTVCISVLGTRSRSAGL